MTTVATILKRLIVALAIRDLISASNAQILINRLGLRGA